MLTLIRFFHILPIDGGYYTLLKKATRDAGPHREGDGKFRHLHTGRSSGLIYVDGGFLLLFYVHDGIFHHPYIVGLWHAWLL
jgi:hypothetical protein